MQTNPIIPKTSPDQTNRETLRGDKCDMRIPTKGHFRRSIECAQYIFCADMQGAVRPDISAQKIGAIVRKENPLFAQSLFAYEEFRINAHADFNLISVFFVSNSFKFA